MVGFCDIEVRKTTADWLNGRLDQDAGQVAPADLAVHEDADHQRVDAGDDTRLGRGEHAAQDAAHDDHRPDQRRPHLARRAPQRAPFEAAVHDAQFGVVRW